MSYTDPYPPPPPSEQPLPPPPRDYNDPYFYDDQYQEQRPEYQSRRRRRSGRKAIAIVIVLLLILLALFLPIYDGQSIADRLLDGYYDELVGNYPEYADIEMTRIIDVSLSGSRINYSIDIPLPNDILGSDGSIVQKVNSYGSTPSAIIVDKYGSEWMTWSGETNQDFLIQISYSIRSYTVRWDMTSELSGTINDIPQDIADIYTDDEWLIEPSLYQVKQKAEEITAGMVNVYDMVEAVYDYMDEEFTYDTGTSGDPKTCTQTLNSKSGDCDDQSILLCSLLRAVGIPAWLEFGVLYDPSTEDFGAHGWANVYIPKKSGGGGSGTVDIVNDEFLVRDPMRFTEWESDGDGNHLEDYYATMDYSYFSPNISINMEDSYSGTYEPSN